MNPNLRNSVWLVNHLKSNRYPHELEYKQL